MLQQKTVNRPRRAACGGVSTRFYFRNSTNRISACEFLTSLFWTVSCAGCCCQFFERQRLIESLWLRSIFCLSSTDRAVSGMLRQNEGKHHPFIFIIFTYHRNTLVHLGSLNTLFEKRLSINHKHNFNKNT